MRRFTDSPFEKMMQEIPRGRDDTTVMAARIMAVAVLHSAIEILQLKTNWRKRIISERCGNTSDKYG